MYILIFMLLRSELEDQGFWTECYQAFPIFNFVFNFLLHAILICYIRSPIFELYQTFIVFVSYLLVFISTYILSTGHEHILIFVTSYFWTDILSGM
jgi:hypothetical protein